MLTNMNHKCHLHKDMSLLLRSLHQEMFINNLNGWLARWFSTMAVTGRLTFICAIFWLSSLLCPRLYPFKVLLYIFMRIIYLDLTVIPTVHCLKVHMLEHHSKNVFSGTLISSPLFNTVTPLTKSQWASLC